MAHSLKLSQESKASSMYLKCHGQRISQTQAKWSVLAMKSMRSFSLFKKMKGKISLGMKQTERNPWEDVEKKYPVGSSVMAEIRSLTNYGAFVELEPGVDGLIHISDLSWIKKSVSPSEILKKGDKIEAIVLSVDKKARRSHWESNNSAQIHGIL